MIVIRVDVELCADMYTEVRSVCKKQNFAERIQVALALKFALELGAKFVLIHAYLNADHCMPHHAV